MMRSAAAEGAERGVEVDGAGPLRGRGAVDAAQQRRTRERARGVEGDRAAARVGDQHVGRARRLAAGARDGRRLRPGRAACAAGAKSAAERAATPRILGRVIPPQLRRIGEDSVTLGGDGAPPVRQDRAMRRWGPARRGARPADRAARGSRATCRSGSPISTPPRCCRHALSRALGVSTRTRRRAVGRRARPLPRARRSGCDRARPCGFDALVSFARRRREDCRSWAVPAARRRASWRKAFRAFRARWPWVEHLRRAGTSATTPASRPRPTQRRGPPVRDARRDSARAAASSAAELLDAPGHVTWLRRFQAALPHRRRCWGLHNYGDVDPRSDGRRRTEAAARRTSRAAVDHRDRRDRPPRRTATAGCAGRRRRARAGERRA